jgi:hypothetical protein
VRDWRSSHLSVEGAATFATMDVLNQSGNLEDAACLSPSDVVVRGDGDCPAAPTCKGLGSHPDAGSRIECWAPASRDGVVHQPTLLCVGDRTDECENEKKGTLLDRSRRHVG